MSSTQQNDALFQSVCASLAALTQIYEALLRLGEEKQALLAAKQDDYDALRRLTEQEETLARSANTKERERLNALSAVAQTMGVSPEALTIRSLCSTLSAPYAQRLQQAAAALQATIERLKEQNAMNRQLLELKLSYSAFMMDLVAQSQAPSSTYGATGLEESNDLDTHRILNSEV